MNLQESLNKSRQETNEGSLPPVQGNMIIRPTEFGDNTVKGEIMSGPNAGTHIELKYASRGDLDKAEFTDSSAKGYVNIDNGGTLRVERVTKGSDDVYNCGYMLTFNGKAEPGNHVIPDAMCKFFDSGQRDRFDRPKQKINQLVLDDQKLVRTLDEMKAAMSVAFASEGGFALFGVDSDNGGVVEASYFLQGQYVNAAGESTKPSYVDGKLADGIKWVDNNPDERADKIMQSYEKSNSIDQIREILKKDGFSIVPLRGYVVGAGTAKNVEKEIEKSTERGRFANITSVDPRQWNISSLGQRVNFALLAKGNNALPEDTVNTLTQGFKSWLNKDEAATFGEKGWTGMSDEKLKGFFASAGVTLKDHPAQGWSTQSLLEMKGDNQPRGMIIKAFTQNQATPYPREVEACKEALSGFYVEAKEAVLAAAETLRTRVDATQEAEKPKDDDSEFENAMSGAMD